MVNDISIVKYAVSVIMSIIPMAMVIINEPRLPILEVTLLLGVCFIPGVNILFMSAAYEVGKDEGVFKR
jgi:hypothetical protein